MDAVSLRYFNVFGPRQPVSSGYSAVFPAFISRMLKNEPAIIYGDGRTTRDFIYVSNVVRANLLAAKRKGRFVGEVMNIGTGMRTSLLELVAALNRTIGTDIEPEHKAERAGDVRDSLADVSRALELTGYVPDIDVAEGLRCTVDYFRAIGD